MHPVDDVESLLDSFPLEPIPSKEGRPYMLVDGILTSAHNTLAGIAIGVDGYTIGFALRVETMPKASEIKRGDRRVHGTNLI